MDEAALTYAEVKALATGNPYIKEKMTLDTQVAKLKLMKANHTSQIYRLEDNIAKHYPQQISTLKERISGLTADIRTVKEKFPADKEQFVMKVGNKVYADKKEAGAAIVEMCREMKHADVSATVGEYAGFQMAVSYDSWNSKFVMGLKGQLTHNFEIGADPLGNITRINHALESMPKKLADAEGRLETVERQLETAKNEVTKPFAQESELAEKLERLSALNALLNMDEKGDEAVGVDDAPEEESRGQDGAGQNAPESMAGHTEEPEHAGGKESAGEQEKTEAGPYWHPMADAGRNDAEDNGTRTPQGLRMAAAAGDKPAQKMSLKEKLAAFKAKASGMEKQEKQKEKGNVMIR